MVKGHLPRTKYPKLRAWARPTRKVMTMVIPSKKDKLKKRQAQKQLTQQEIEEGLKNKS
jgi:hypothetical protein